MPKSRSNREDEGATGDERLKVLLSEWRGLDPGADFETAVWRRIRSDSVPEPHGLSPIGMFRKRIPPRQARAGALTGPWRRPVWAAAAAVLAGILLGAWAGWISPPAAARHGSDQVLLHARTLAGSYAALTAGGSR